jgi:hypothetical protein
MSILVLTSDTLIGTPAAGNLEYNGQFFGTDSNASRAQMQRYAQGTAVASTSGTSINFTNLPSWCERITILFQAVSTTGTSNVGIQLGTGGTPTYVVTGYLSNGNTIAGAAVSSASYTTLFGLGSANQVAASSMQGQMVLTNITGNNWVFSGTTSQTNTNASHFGNGSLSLGAALTAVRITTVAGTDTFDAGTINIMYEG